MADYLWALASAVLAFALSLWLYRRDGQKVVTDG